MQDPHRLQRFVDAQDDDGTYEVALRELRDGRKRSHWMWFIFPQLAGLGQSPTSRRYAISSLEEARAYVEHPVLGPRLQECSRALLGRTGASARDIFGGIDAMKLRSSMTLFHRADPDNALYSEVLDRYFDGEHDSATDRLLAASG
jgi:uncharacterized protein (DUF1810 family)